MEQLIAALEGALPSIASFMIIAVITWLITKLKKGKFSISNFLSEHRKIPELSKDVKELKTEIFEDIKDLKTEVAQVKEFAERSDEENKSVARNDVKSHIVSVYERCVDRGYITPMELETVNRLNDSYHNTLNGNTYIHVIIRQMNNDIPVKGIPIPEH